MLLNSFYHLNIVLSKQDQLLTASKTIADKSYSREQCMKIDEISHFEGQLFLDDSDKKT
jgi:hypothetical protein